MNSLPGACADLVSSRAPNAPNAPNARTDRCHGCPSVRRLARLEPSLRMPSSGSDGSTCGSKDLFIPGCTPYFYVRRPLVLMRSFIQYRSLMSLCFALDTIQEQSTCYMCMYIQQLMKQEKSFVRQARYSINYTSTYSTYSVRYGTWISERARPKCCRRLDDRWVVSIIESVWLTKESINVTYHTHDIFSVRI